MKYNVLFLGGRIFGYKALKVLIDNYSDFFDIKIAIGMKNEGNTSLDWNPSIYNLAKQNKINFLDPSSLKDDWINTIIENSDIDYLFNVFCDRIIPKNILNRIREKSINFHFGKLPEYRGRNIVPNVIINEEKYITNTSHIIDAKIDTGNIIDESKIEIRNNENARSLYLRCTENGLVQFENVLNKIVENKDIRTYTQKGISQYYKMIPNNGYIDLNLSVEDEYKIDKQIRSFTFQPTFFPKMSICGKDYIIIEDTILKELL